MPWKETNPMTEKEQFITEMLKAEMPFNHLCAKYGITEKTGYKWKKRFLDEGKYGLQEISHANETHPNALPEDTVIRLIKLKTDHPYWGGKKIQILYARAYPDEDVPSLSSVNRVLDKAGLVRKHRVKPASNDCRRLHQHIQPVEVNDVWAIDFKGWWKSDGEICEPFTVRDLVSRKILCVRLMQSKDANAIKSVMSELFREYGLPKVIRSDNGTPFTSSYGLLSLTKLSAWWITLGITPDRTEKGTPGQNGSLERMHADISREIQGKIPGGIAANQAVIDEWVKEYNSVRPNEALGMRVPDDIYVPSPRKYSGDYDEIEYPMGFLSRKVDTSGLIKLDGISVSVGASLSRLNVGLRPSREGNSYDVFLADFLLGTLNTETYCFIPLDVIK